MQTERNNRYRLSVGVTWFGLLLQSFWLLWQFKSGLSVLDADLFHSFLDLLASLFFLTGYSVGNLAFGYALGFHFLVSRALEIWFFARLGYGLVFCVLTGFGYLSIFLILARGIHGLSEIKKERRGGSRNWQSLLLLPLLPLILMVHLRFVKHVQKTYIAEIWLPQEITAEMVEQWKARFRFLKENEVQFFSHVGFVNGSEVFGIITPKRIYSIYSDIRGPEVTVFDNARIQEVKISEDYSSRRFDVIEIVPTWGDSIYLYSRPDSKESSRLLEVLHLKMNENA